MENSEKVSIAGIFDVFGGPSAFAKAIGVGVSTASEMKRRGRIPAEYWRDLIRAARRRGRPEVTAELLVELHARDTRQVTMPGFSEEESNPLDAPTQQPKPAAAGNATGHFSRHKHIRRPNFRTAEEIEEHIRALREEWSHR